MALPTIYVDTAGSATNSGSSDNNAADVSGAAAACNPSSTTVDLSVDAPDLSAVPTDGSATIYLVGATNSNQKIFRITGTDNIAKTVTVDTAPTGNFTGSAWAIGGRFVWTTASIEGALKAGWTVIFNNSVASSASAIITARNSGDSTNGMITIRGKTGVRPVLTCTGTVNVIAPNSQTYWRIENLELVQQGASGNALDCGANWIGNNTKVSDAGASGISMGANTSSIMASEVSGTVTGITGGNSGVVVDVSGCYIHDVSGDGFVSNAANPTGTVRNSILDSCGGRGLNFSSGSATTSTRMMLDGLTVYGCGDSGLEVATAKMIILQNSIFSENGNAAGEYNVEFTSAVTEAMAPHSNNIFYKSSGNNILNLTTNSTESTSDPLLTDPANGDFTLQSGSPAKATGFPGTFLGGPTGYLDMGAVQRKEPSVGVIGS